MPAATDDIWATLETIPDPELPIGILDLGIILDVARNGSDVHVTMTPTFIGCPALNVVQDEIRRKVRALPGVKHVEVEVRFDPPWSPARMSEKGRETLRQLGIGVPEPASCIGTRLAGGGVAPALPPAPCPWCKSPDTVMSSPFGPQRCRMIYYCNACKKPFEQFKPM